jgi:hypothetical protein
VLVKHLPLVLKARGQASDQIDVSKKTDVVDATAFDHVGLLFNEPSSEAGLPFILSSDRFHCNQADTAFNRNSVCNHPTPAREEISLFTGLAHLSCVACRSAG